MIEKTRNATKAVIGRSHRVWMSCPNASITRGAPAHSSAAMTFTVPAVFLRFERSSFGLLDAMRPSAYGIYLLHFIPLIWLQYAVYDPAFPAFAKFAIVFTGTLSISWALTVLLRKMSTVARMI